MLACKKTRVYIHLQSGSRDYTPPGNQSKSHIESVHLFQKFRHVSSTTTAPESNLLASPSSDLLDQRQQQFRGHPVREPGSSQMVLFRLVSSFFLFFLDGFLFDLPPAIAVGRQEKRKDAKGRGKSSVVFITSFSSSAPTRKRLNFTLFLLGGDASTSRVFDSPSWCLMFICARSPV